MPVMIIRDERNIRDLGPRLLGRADVEEVPERVVRALRDANPEVDLGDLRPGTVLRVPDVEDVRVRDDAVAEDLLGEGIDRMTGALNDVVATLGARAEEQGKVEAADRATVRRTLGLKAVREAAKRDEDLRANLDRVEEELATADQAADDAAATRKESVATWAADLEAITGSGP